MDARRGGDGEPPDSLILDPREISQKPFFQMLGTPAEQKKYIVYEGGHDVPRTALITETLAWLDKYLGPAR